jgi:hypothetical protein
VGTGFRPGAPVDVLQCRPGIVNIADCNVPFVRTVADATGHFAASPTVRDYVGPSHLFDIHGVAPYDCVITSVDCVIAAAEETDFEHTVVSTPVDVLVTPVINVSAPLVSEHSGQMQVSVQLSRPSAQVVSVDWATVRDETNPLDPIPGIDYVAATGVVTFQPGTTQAIATVTLLDDNMYEPQERLMFAFTNPVNATLSNNGVASGGILNDDPQPQVLPRNTSTVEGDNGSHTVDVTVALSNPSYQTITVPWNTVTPAPTFAPPAQAGVDFATASGTLVFAPGESSKTVSITVNGDNQAEVDETFGVTLGVPTNATRPTGLKHVGWVTIVDDDSVVVQPGTGSVVEGDTGTSTLQVPVTLSTPWPDPVVVSWRTIFPAGGGSGLADPSSDYTAANGTVTFAPGETNKVVNVAVNGDDVPEPDEFVLVAFASTTPNVRVGGLWGLGGGIITNDD